ncbi:uncharacterized [Tachysurus ichikawai]
MTSSDMINHEVHYKAQQQTRIRFTFFLFFSLLLKGKLKTKGSLLLEWICQPGLEDFSSLLRVKDPAERGRMLK